MLAFTIATYNIHKCRGLDRRVRPERIVEVLKETGADIIALQEVVGLDEADRQHNQVLRIAEALGFHYQIGGNRRLHGAAYGNAVLTHACQSWRVKITTLPGVTVSRADVWKSF